MQLFVEEPDNTTNSNISPECMMYITISSGISADIINISVVDTSTDSVVFDQEYSYGYNASYDKRWATSDQPYMKDIIDNIKAQFNITDIEVIAGKNHFKGTSVGSDVIDRFKSTYLETAENTKERRMSMKLFIEEYDDATVDVMDLIKDIDPDDIDHHQSDLYLRKTPETTAIIKQLPPGVSSMVTTFIDPIDHVRWYEIPFAYHK